MKLKEKKREEKKRGRLMPGLGISGPVHSMVVGRTGLARRLEHPQTTNI